MTHRNFRMHRGWGAHNSQVQLKDAQTVAPILAFTYGMTFLKCATDSDREERVRAELAHKSNRSEQVVNPMSIVPPFTQEAGGGASGCEFFSPYASV